MTPITTNTTIDDIDNALRQAAHEMLTTGVLHLKEMPHVPEPTFRKIMRLVAREHKRPFVFMQNYTVTMPKQKRLSCLVVPWTLIASPWAWRSDGDWRVMLLDQPTLWTLRFRTKEFYMEWFEATQTRAEMREALKLP
jgi:hypothetical protein